jgi:hypothetical protein
MGRVPGSHIKAETRDGKKDHDLIAFQVYGVAFFRIFKPVLFLFLLGWLV